ncbi:MAG: DUF366 family protein [Alphaproteobacteria bacterium]|nr:DUF366 family protein [Alphaproteobacteria bacterium]
MIHDRFAYKFFKKQVNPTGNIIAYIAPMEVTDNLIDLEDSINKDYIYSDSAINFIIELPQTQDLFAGVCFQRLLNAQVGSLLCAKHLNIEGFVDGDDIMILTGEGEAKVPKKASVSIAAKKNDAILIHLGINIDAGNRAPDFAYSTKLTDEQAEEFINDVFNVFYNMVGDIFVATTKVIV